MALEFAEIVQVADPRVSVEQVSRRHVGMCFSRIATMNAFLYLEHSGLSTEKSFDQQWVLTLTC